jgi:hypothetical protein
MEIMSEFWLRIPLQNTADLPTAVAMFKAVYGIGVNKIYYVKVYCECPNPTQLEK